MAFQIAVPLAIVSVVCGLTYVCSGSSNMMIIVLVGMYIVVVAISSFLNVHDPARYGNNV